MAVRVVVGADASQKAQQFLNSVNDLNTALDKAKHLGDQLADKNDWDGASASKFRDDLAQFHTHAQKMHDTLQKMGNGAKSVISEVDSADNKGQTAIGGSSF